MAVKGPFVIAIFSLLLAVNTLVVEFIPKRGKSYFWLKMSFSALGLLLSILPVIIGIMVFIRTKGSRFKVFQKAVLSYLTVDMYNEINYKLWVMNKSVYCNILIEQVEFYRDDYRVVLTPAEAESEQQKSTYRHDQFLKIDFGFQKYDSKVGKRQGLTESENNENRKLLQVRYDEYFTERVSIHLRKDNIAILGTLIVKDNLCAYSKGEIFVRGDHKLDNKGYLNKDDHAIVDYHKIYEKTGLGELKIEAFYDPWSSELSLSMKCNSFPQGKKQTMPKCDRDDFINLIKLIEYYDEETGWVVMKNGEIRMRSRGANIFHGTHFLQMLELMRKGCDLFEINISTDSEPCLVEDNDAFTPGVYVQRLSLCLSHFWEKLWTEGTEVRARNQCKGEGHRSVS